MIFSSLKFLIFWIFNLFLGKKLRFNTPLAFGAIGLLFYSFQGIINFSALFFVFLISYIYLLLNKYLIIFILLALLPLFLFKYLSILTFLSPNSEIINFFVNHPIPPGLSFTTFSAIALLISIKQRVFENLDYKKIIGYLFFFPQLIAGPIVMPNYLIPQLSSLPKIYLKNFQLGFFIFTVGIILKILVADSISEYIDPIFKDLEKNSFKDILVSIILFSQQIFFDFNGYTLMAIGIALSLGIKLPENFNAPYLATSVSDFWRRWHITLSNWIRDYIYIPLGGSKCSNIKNYTNILIAMIVSGIWHGYGIAFILWGFFHGIIIVGEKFFNINLDYKILKIFLTYLTVTILWSFFRINSIDDWLIIINKFNFIEFLSIKVFFIFFLTFILNFLQKFLTIKSLEIIYKKLNSTIAINVSILIVLFCIILSSGSSQKFIYFNF